MWIDAQIRAGNHPNASSVAARFEISRRQAARDLEYMRYSLGAPLDYVAAQRGYRYADAHYFVPAFLLSGDERTALAEIAHRHAVSGSRAADLAGLFRRIAATAAPSPETAPAAGDPDDDPVGAPYRAVVRFAGEDPVEIEFRSSASLFPTLLAGPPFTIERPRWLRDRLVSHLRAILAAHDETPAGAVTAP